MIRIRSAARPAAAVAASLLLLAAIAATSASARTYGPWSRAVDAESLPGTSTQLNTTAVDGCPILSPDGLSLYMASNRGGLGGLDIWVAHRASRGAPFGDPVNLGAPINSTADDFCPTPVRGKGLFFVSARSVAGACGAGDIYFARNNPAHGWTNPPVHLGCDVNSPAGEAAPSYFEADGTAYLYFSRGPDIFVSVQRADGTFAAAQPVPSLNSPMDDFRPNVRKDGLEVVFDSNRGGFGGQDLYFATRGSVLDAWSTPVNGGPNLNTAANETRGSFSWDARRLYFGRTPGPEGQTDIFTSTR